MHLDDLQDLARQGIRPLVSVIWMTLSAATFPDMGIPISGFRPYNEHRVKNTETLIVTGFEPCKEHCYYAPDYKVLWRWRITSELYSMPTQNRRIATYLPKDVDEKFQAFKLERGLNGDSSALIAILEEFLGVSQKATHLHSSEFDELSVRISELRGELAALRGELF